MLIKSVKIFFEKCHNNTFLHDITFSRPLYDGDVKFCCRICKKPNKNKVLCRQGILRTRPSHFYNISGH